MYQSKCCCNARGVIKNFNGSGLIYFYLSGSTAYMAGFSLYYMPVFICYAVIREYKY